jgi:phosphoglucomutase
LTRVGEAASFELLIKGTRMAIHERAGHPILAGELIDLGRLERDYYERQPDPENPLQRVNFGTSGHRGTSIQGTFTEQHVLAITQAICEYRRSQGIAGPLFLGKDTHALSGPAQRTALEVLAANGMEVWIQEQDGCTPTPAISRSILVHNHGEPAQRADGMVITPSHNPPSDGGLKYNPPHGGPADTDVTGWIEARANQLLRAGNLQVRRLTYEAALRASTTRQMDYVMPYVEELSQVVDLDVVRSAGIRIGVDPLGGAALPYWEPIQRHYGLELTVINDRVDPQFGFMRLDHDGKIRMDCSSAYAMAGLIEWKDRFDIAFGNDPDADRHGIVTPSAGLMNPNHYLAVAIDYLLRHRDQWPGASSVGKTLVSSGLIDRVVRRLNRRLIEVPVGFKWFAPGLRDGSICFGGEESAGASFLRFNGSAWSTDKDGLILGLLAAEITARTGKDPSEHYRQLTVDLGAPCYTRIDTPISAEQKAGFARLTPEAVASAELAGDPIQDRLTHAPGNGAAIGGLKVTTARGWFAARPSGTENLYKLYAESFESELHLAELVREARNLVEEALTCRSG